MQKNMYLKMDFCDAGRFPGKIYVYRENDMTDHDIVEIAMEQSAVDLNCRAGDFRKTENVVVVSAQREGARKYLTLPFDCDLVSYGNNIVASVKEELSGTVEAYINRYPAEHCFETPNMHVLNDELQKCGLRICFMAEYFLPKTELLRDLSCDFEMKLLGAADFEDLYTAEWSNALSKERKHLDMLGVGAYDKGKLVGMAGASADCDTMWQIGVDVLPEFRRQGIACALTSRLALEILDRGKVPFYCAAWSNVKSVRNAIKSGFRPAWVEMTARSTEFVAGMNKRR